MDLLTLSSFPAALLVWQLTPSRWVITVVCKATYILQPGVVATAPEQEPIHEEDAHWEDDPRKSLFCPSDLVPFKPRADVTLVGSAYARNGQPARSIIVRLNVGKIDKSIEVLCPRVRTRDGELREGKRWTKMPLLYERAAGGPGTDNPVGISLDGARDTYGQLALPNLQAPGLNLPPDKLPPPIGFGPISAAFPARKGRLPRGDDERDYARSPFGDGFDPAYFQAAPPDQQLDALRPNERIALDNLLSKHPVFVTALPGDKIRARVETSGVAPREVPLTPDTLWIDTDRGLCTVTHRAKIDVDHPEQEGRILVAATRTEQPIPWARLAPAPSPPSSQSPPPPLGTPSLTAAPRAPLPGTVVSPTGAPKAPSAPGRISTPPAPGLPTSAAGGLPTSPGSALAASSSASASTPPSSPVAPAPPPVPARAGSSPSTPPLVPRVPPPPAPDDEPPPSNDEPRTVDIDLEVLDAVEVTSTEHPSRSMTQTAALRPITAPGTMLVSDLPALPFQPAPPGWTPPAAVPSRPGLPPLPGVPKDLTTTPAFGAPIARATLPDWYETAPPAPPPPVEPAPLPPPLITSPAWSALTPQKPVPLAGAAPLEGPLGALEASNAAASLAEPRPPSSDAIRPEIEASPTPQPAPSAAVVVELLWFDPSAAARHSTHSLLSVFKRPAPKPADPAPPAKPEGAPAPPDPPANEPDPARALLHDALSRSAPTALGALESVLESAEEESPPGAALAVVTGTLEMSLDEIEMLRAVTAAAAPLAASDKKLKEVLEVASDMLKTPMQGMPDFAASLSQRIRDAWTRANRALPPDHLTSSTERLLLEQRAYQTRDLLDDTWIRAEITADGVSVPVYLPAKIAKRLPLFRRFQARILAEVVWQQDQYETHPLALRALALGRLSSRSRKKRPADGSRPRY